MSAWVGGYDEPGAPLIDLRSVFKIYGSGESGVGALAGLEGKMIGKP